MGEGDEGYTGEGHIGDAAVLRAAGALLARLLAGFDQVLCPITAINPVNRMRRPN
jgi:hypothetical protein